MLLFVARPSKKQQAATKRAKADARRSERLDLAYRRTPFLLLADFAVVECERCGQEQVEPMAPRPGHVEGDVSPCVVCGHDVARTAPTHESFLAEARAWLAA